MSRLLNILMAALSLGLVAMTFLGTGSATPRFEELSREVTVAQEEPKLRARPSVKRWVPRPTTPPRSIREGSRSYSSSGRRSVSGGSFSFGK